MQTKPFFEIGIIAHNEARNICSLIDALLIQADNTKLPFNVIVIASGCRDGTEDIVKGCKNRDNRIELLIEKQRNGKASAINHFLNRVSGEISVISSADVIPADNTLNKLLEVFFDPKIGMAGVRVIPKNSPGLAGLLNKLLWELHHEVALLRPKLGEFIAIRNIVDRIPEETAADEASLEAIVTKKGFKIKYIPDAIIYNYGPKNLAEFIKKRIRIFVGHLYVRDTMRYYVSTYKIRSLIPTVAKKLKNEKMNALYIICLTCLEIFARALSCFDYYIRKKTYHIWSRN